jgi:hypothetical protein
MPFKEEFITEKKLRRKTIISFSVFIVMIAVAVFGWKLFFQETEDDAGPKPIVRKALNFNESIFSNLSFNNNTFKSANGLFLLLPHNLPFIFIFNSDSSIANSLNELLETDINL